MFSTIASNTKLIQSTHESVTTPGIIQYSNIESEEAYLRSLYPVTEFDVDRYIEESDDITVVKSASIDNSIEYKALIHEIYLTLNLFDGISKLQKILAVKFTTNELHVIYEYITGVTLYQIIDNYFFGSEHDINKVIVALSNTMAQLDYLYSVYKLTHYDLHPGNIMVGDSDITIIDLEMSHAELDGEHYGITLLSVDDIYSLTTPTYYWPSDIFKLLGFIKLHISNMELRTEETITRQRVVYNTEYEKAISEGKTDYAQDVLDSLNALEGEYSYRINMLKKSLPNNNLEKYINTLIAYFMSLDTFDEYAKVSYYLGAPRLDLIPEYNKYLTNFDHFYEYYSNITDMFTQ